MTNKNQSDSERRRFFRIDDEISLEYDFINEEEYANAPAELEKIEKSSFSLSSIFATLNNEHAPTLNSIRTAEPEIAQYLDLLNKKIDYINAHLLEEEVNDLKENICTVNLSASGIAFKSQNNIPDNQPVKLRIILLPEKIGVTIYGRAQENLLSPEQKKMGITCIDFEHIRYADQELMIKHNLNKQMQQLRERNEDGIK